MKKPIVPIAVLLLGLSTASNAVSTTYDFAAEGNLNEAGYSTFDSDDHNSTTSTDPTIQSNHAGVGAYQMPGGLSISASNGGGLTSIPIAVDGSTGAVSTVKPDMTIGMVPYWAYFDGNTSNSDTSRNAGLGVCKIALGACAGNSDDNHMQGEFIHMLFDEVVEILSLDITGDHVAVQTGAKMLYSLDSGTSWASLDIAGQIWGTDLTVNWLLTNKTLDYTITPDTGQMYLSAMTVSPVPVPAAIWLFGTALIGFIGISRRTNLA